jgi:hypothetical protein
MTLENRRFIAWMAGIFGGGLLFYFAFAAIFNGVWPLMVVFVMCFAPAGALGVAFGGMTPKAMGMALALPLLPWIGFLLPATMRSSGVWKGLFWIALVGVIYGLGWLGGVLVAKRRAGVAALVGAGDQ